MRSPIRVSTPPVKPLMVYDGDCNFCRRWVARWRQMTGERVEYAPFQDPQIAARFPEIPPADLARALHLIEPDGAVFAGAEAVFRARGRRWLYDHVPGWAPASEWAYRRVARNRPLFSWLTAVLWGPDVAPASHFLTRWVFLRLLGIIYLIAFVSLWMQVTGLVGQNGILPVGELIQQVRQQAAEQHVGLLRYWQVPTLCWLGAGNGFLHAQCAAGVAAAVLLVLGIAPLPTLALLWLLYLSLATVSEVFLGYQWDALLLETGLLAVFFAPRQLRPGLAREGPPSRAALWLLRLLLFKLMFCSGLVKLSSGDPTWHSLTALTFHYETQPLPTVLGWYAHHLPVWFQKLSCAVLFAIELGCAFLIFAPRRLRFAGCAAVVGLMLLIAATGNYCFFNWLAVALCVLLLDDAALSRWRRQPAPVADGRRSPVRWLLAPAAALYIGLSAMLVVNAFRAEVAWPRWLASLAWRVAPLRSVNGYGLFAVMTTSRPEIVVEGSDNGETWRAYEFRYKPGDPERRPRFVAPHQPRLDWQMWFEALRTLDPMRRPSPWFVGFCVRLLQGQPEVLALLRANPFPTGPPRYVRAVVYDYRMTDLATHRATGAWWRRERRGVYCPALSLR